MRKSKQEQSSWVRTDQLGLLGNYFESAELIRFDKIYLIFMSVCFKSFEVSHVFFGDCCSRSKLRGLGQLDNIPKHL